MSGDAFFICLFTGILGRVDCNGHLFRTATVTLSLQRQLLTIVEEQRRFTVAGLVCAGRSANDIIIATGYPKSTVTVYRTVGTIDA